MTTGRRARLNTYPESLITVALSAIGVLSTRGFLVQHISTSIVVIDTTISYLPWLLGSQLFASALTVRRKINDCGNAAMRSETVDQI
jgi:hypothetical protein